ncbi:MAG: transcription-repair coupling factor [Thiobacillaceae bacterium]|jgi:transcription-repair coupling factor (superfamily II helicase)|nr:transcription-repair coupling factor [Thiobacillaceae bacterium]
MPAVPRLPPSGQRSRLDLPPGSADSLVLAGLARSARLLVLTESAQAAARIAEEASWFEPALAVRLFPDWETLPYDPLSPHPDLVSERLETLWQASQGKVDLLVAPAATATQRLAPPEFLAAHAFLLKLGERLDVEALRERLTRAGYGHVNQVLSPGEFAVRGGLIDLFPTGAALPFRIELLDDEVESLRTFDPDTQRTLYKVNEIRLLPAREFPLDEAGVTRFRQAFRDRFEGDPSKSRLYKDVSHKLAPAGVEYYLPLFFDTMSTLFDYLPAEVTVVLHGDVQRAVEGFWADTQGRHRLLLGDRDRPLLSPDALFLPPDAFYGRLRPYARIELADRTPGRQADGDVGLKPDLRPDPQPGLQPEPRRDSEHSLPYEPPPEVATDRRAEDPYARLKAHLARFDGATLLVAESLGRRETMASALAEYGLKPELHEGWVSPHASPLAPRALLLTTGPLAAGFVDTEARRAVLTETELYARSPTARAARAARQTQVEGLLRDLSELKLGDPVVHVQHGIGRYRGLTGMDLGEGPEEFLTLEYAGGDKLYVPVAHLQLIARYMGGDPETAPLHRLGSGQWEKAKRRAMEKARDTAAELLNLYAQRAVRQGHAFEVGHHDLDAFAEGFGFEETPDQLAAIEAVVTDMRSGRPMDRLVCGDVGFGKTEVALRAAFVAVSGGRQVAVLCPTTLLAEQHFQTFSDRFADFPVKIAELSRFRSPKEVAAALDGLKGGRIDIVIGTHKLLQKDIVFRNLGLVIIDEEHRFGVRQKERLKELRAEVDVLTLTATPIPRTLAMSLEGIRDFSVIATAPQKRLAIKTFVHPWSDGLIREAVLRELKRGGQIYFLHNEVESIATMGEKLENLLPEARIQIAHGQMAERELEHVMRDFYHQRFNLLLCTTIIETGINVPTANTILMNRADKFGLAQLHQLRGRVGRSHHQAYAYLLTPPGAKITPAAQKRLEAIQLMEELGSGFYLAMQDLEIRGAGEVLGEDQSGEMQEVGFNLFNDMLNIAVKSLKEGREPDLEAPLAVTAEINLHLPALLPEDYCADVHERLVLYKRLASCQSEAELRTMEEELIDRFGLPPQPARTLLEVHRLRIRTQPLGITRLEAGPDNASVQFVSNPPIDPARLIRLIQTKREYKLAGQDRLRIERSAETLDERLRVVRDFLQEIS